MHRPALYWLLTVTLALPAPARAVSPDPAALAVPPDQVSRARELIRRLGSASFRERDRATRELRKMGRFALPALTERQDDPDPEVRMRVDAILPQAAAEDLRAKVDAFLADAAGRYTHDLPGWPRFRALAGDTRATRDLFAEVVKDKENHEILLAMRGVPAGRAAGLAALAGAASESAADRPPPAELLHALDGRQQFAQARLNPVFPAGVRRVVPPDLPDVALLLVADSLVSEKDHPRTQFQYQLANYLHLPSVSNAALGNGPYGPAFRRVLRHWMDTRGGSVGLANAMRLASNLRFDVSVVNGYAARILMLDAPGQGWQKMNAAVVLARNNAKAHLFTLTRAFDDETVVVAGVGRNPNGRIRVQDIMLAMALVMTGQNPTKYGFAANNPTPDGWRANYSNYYFTDSGSATAEAARAAAFAKWAKWEGNLHASLAGPAGTALVMKKYPAKDHAK